MKREFGESGGGLDRRDFLADKAFPVWQEHSERLFFAHWLKALDGDYRSAEICRKLLANMALIYVLQQQGSVKRPGRHGAVDHIVPADMDELARLRADRVMGG